MKLGIISDAHHYYDSAGHLCSLTPVVRQFEQWAGLFEEVIVCAPYVLGQVPQTCTPYRVDNLRLLPVASAGGNTLKAKLDLIKKSYGWWQAIQELIQQVDAVHIRCPNNISILGLIALHKSNLYRQAVYTGAWYGKGYITESLTYRFQQWYLQHLFRGPVAVYGKLLSDPSNIVSSFSPSYTMNDWLQEKEGVKLKVKELEKTNSFQRPIRLVSVGSLDKRKNHQFLLHSLKVLEQKRIKFELHILGDGELRSSLQTLITELGLNGNVTLCGKVSQEHVRVAYRNADFVLQSPLLEGYGKVPIEAFFHGAIPIISDVNVSPQIIGETERGRCFSLQDYTAISKHIIDLSQNPNEMIRLIENGRTYARTRTLESWQSHIKQMLEEHWHVKLKYSNKTIQ